MKIPENILCGRIKLESYFISHISNYFLGKYCKIIINDFEMFTKLESGTSECAKKMLDKFLNGEWIGVVVLKGSAPNNYITDEQYRHGRYCQIKLEENKEWVSIK
jgi:hypothetical protein